MFVLVNPRSNKTIWATASLARRSLFIWAVELIFELVEFFVDKLLNILFFKQCSWAEYLTSYDFIIRKVMTICYHFGALLLFWEWNISIVNHRSIVHGRLWPSITYIQLSMKMSLRSLEIKDFILETEFFVEFSLVHENLLSLALFCTIYLLLLAAAGIFIAWVVVILSKLHHMSSLFGSSLLLLFIYNGL